MSASVAITTTAVVVATQPNHGNLPAAMWQLIMLFVVLAFCMFWLFNSNIKEETREKAGPFPFIILVGIGIFLIPICNKLFG